MPIQILMPALSPTMTEGTVAKWLVNEGDEVKSGAVMAEIETDKATMEFEAVDEGRIGKILVPAGTENVAVNTPIAILLEEGEDLSAIEKVAKPRPAPTPSPAKTEPASAPAPAAKPAAPAQPSPAGGNGETPAGNRIVVSPLARRMAEQANLDLSRLQGSGPNGRIVKTDVEQALAGGAIAQARAPAPQPQPVLPQGGYIEVPLSNVRRTIARRLSEAKQTIPHFYLTIHCEIDDLLKLRQKLNARGDGYKLSVNDFVIRASALALKKVPDANAAWGGDKILKYNDADISVAVAIKDGLITPIIRRADAKGLAQISNEMKDLAERAKNGKLKLDEFQGGSFSISNLGMYGISEFAAIINPPQAAILSVGVGEQRPVVRNGTLAVATMMTCTLCCDHRVVDGVLGAELLAAFKGYVEDPLTMLL